jgi:endoglucanase
MLPEGLQYNSVANIVGLIKSLDMNVVRLTFAIGMVDDIYSDSPDQSLQATLIKALGQANGTTILKQILDNNPDFTTETTRLEVCRGKWSLWDA